MEFPGRIRQGYGAPGTILRQRFCYLGCVAPTITMLRKKILLMSHLAYCGPLRMALV
jgi:hypothetical protein